MKKGTKITRVTIQNGKVTAYGRIKNGDEFVVPLTRTQRSIFMHYMDPDFSEKVFREFKTDILSDHFTVSNQ